MNAPARPADRRCIHQHHDYTLPVPFLLMDSADAYALEQMETVEDADPEYDTH
jgi:hypothetical protein